MHVSAVVQSIIQDVKGHVEHLKDLSWENAKIQRMTGITNETYKVTLKNSNLAPIIYRRFGQSDTNLFLDRNTQKIIYKHVSNQQLGPKIHCYIGQHTRIEQFIQSRVLTSQDMLTDEAIQNVAYALHKFHFMNDPASVERKSLIDSIFFQKGEQMMKICNEKMGRNIYTEREKELIGYFRKWIHPEEIQFIKQAVKPLQKQGLVFSHNDLLANNILIQNKDSKYVFIDYEYSTYNYAIFDIANYFNQFQYDYDVTETPFFGRNNPPKNIQELREKFIRCYCLAADKSYAEYEMALKDQGQIAKVKDRVQHLLSQFALGTMLSNLMWGWWAVIVCKNPNINFDYLEFCKVRYDNYFEVKNTGRWKINV